MYTEANVTEMTSEACAVPMRRSQANVAIAARTIGVALPVLSRGRMEVQGAATAPRQICHRAQRFSIRQVLHDVITNDQVERRAWPVFGERGMYPAELLAQVLAHFQPNVRRTRKRLEQPGPHPPEPTPRIENPSHRQPQVPDHRPDRQRTPVHFRASRDPRARIRVVAFVEA